MFYRWLALAKKSRHRRLQLQAKEEEFKLTVIAGAWDKWRERFLDIRLQPMVSVSRIHDRCFTECQCRPTFSLNSVSGISYCVLTVSGIRNLW